MSKTRILGTVEWMDWSDLPNNEAAGPTGGGHDHGANGLDFGPPPSSAVSLIISGQVSVQPPYIEDDDTGTSGILLPVYTPEWTNQGSEHPGRAPDKLAMEDAVTKKVSLTIPGQISTPPIYFDDEEFDLGGMSDLSGVSDEQTDLEANLSRLGDHGILVDFEDDTFDIAELLDQLAQPDTDPDDPNGTPDSIETPTAPEPPAPHAMAQFILIVGMVDAPSDDTAGADDGGLAAGIV